MINKLLVQQFNCKFIQSTVFSKIENTTIIGAQINNNLYKIYYTYNPTHILLIGDILTTETIQFISDFCLVKTIYVYHKNLSEPNLQILQDYNVTHIVHEPIDGTKYKYIIYDANTINHQLFFNDDSNKNESIICFLDDCDTIPLDLAEYLYPNSKLPIKLFNNPRVSHPQNLGVLNEIHKGLLLRTNKYYLSLNSSEDYSLEAAQCGCRVLQLSDLNSYSNHASVHDNIIKSNTNDHIQFIKERILV